MREITFAVALAVAGALIATGAFLIHDAAGFVVAGVLVGAWSWLVLSVGDAS